MSDTVVLFRAASYECQPWLMHVRDKGIVAISVDDKQLDISRFLFVVDPKQTKDTILDHSKRDTLKQTNQ